MNEEKIILTIPGDPKAQKRHRHFSKKFNNGKEFSGTYDPSAKEKKDFLLTILNNKPDKPFECPICIKFYFHFPRPKNHYGTGKNSNKLKSNAPSLCAKKPDYDNLLKFVTDALNKIYFKDDAQVCTGSFYKYYSENPRTEIIIIPLYER
jgi:Holliday junction resolvase RusA-like endonuclease